jgi:hypothetical protein
MHKASIKSFENKHFSYMNPLSQLIGRRTKIINYCKSAESEACPQTAIEWKNG